MAIFAGPEYLDGMKTSASLPLSSAGHELDTSQSSWGELEDSSMLRHDPIALRKKMREQGYLFMRSFFDRELIQEARDTLLAQLNEPGIFDPGYPLDKGVLLPGVNPMSLPHTLLKDNLAVRRVVFGPEIVAFYRELLDGEVRHFDHIWGRAIGKGAGTHPHCDIVYMGRGTRNLCTAWIPFGDVSYELGGLMVLENSHRQADRIRNYLTSDVDTFCEDNPSRHGWKFHGWLSSNAASLREKFGGRWLSTAFQMGDLLTFSMETVHASTDNQTDRIRISTDTRYQLESEPIDERWIGESPIGHGPNAKKGLIC